MMFRSRRLMAPEGEVSPAVTPPVPPVAQPAKVVTVDDLPPEALKQRLDQAKHSGQTELLASWGVTDPAQVKAYIDGARAAEEAKKSNEQRIAEQSVKLTAYEEGLAVAVETFGATIKPEQKAAVDAIAGTDKALWLKTYRALAPTWIAAAPSIPAAPPAVPPVAPATGAALATAPQVPPAPPPNGTPPVSPPNHKEVYERIQKTNPFAASQYLDKYGDACFK